MSNNRRNAPPLPPGDGQVSPAKHSSQQQQQQQQQQQPGYDLLQMKYLTVDRNYETLKNLTRKGIAPL